MSKEPLRKKYGFIGISGLQFHVWRNNIVFAEDNYIQLENETLTFIPKENSVDEAKCRQYAAIDAAAEMFKTERGVGSHNSRIYILSLWVPEDGICEDDTVKLRDIESSDVVRIYEIPVTHDLIRVGSLKCILDDPEKWQSNFITQQEACELLEKYIENAKNWVSRCLNPTAVLDATDMYYLDPLYISLDAIRGKKALAAGVTLLHDIIDKTRYDLPKGTQEQMRFPVQITSLRMRRTCTVDLLDMLQDYTPDEIKNKLRTESVHSFIINWTISHYANIARWRAAELIVTNQDSNEEIALMNWPITCEYMEKEAFLVHMEALSATK